VRVGSQKMGCPRAGEHAQVRTYLGDFQISDLPQNLRDFATAKAEIVSSLRSFGLDDGIASRRRSDATVGGVEAWQR
jgi:hypothetical protein